MRPIELARKARISPQRMCDIRAGRIGVSQVVARGLARVLRRHGEATSETELRSALRYPTRNRAGAERQADGGLR